MIDIMKEYGKWREKRRKELDMDIEFLGSEFFNFIHLILKDKGIEERTLIKKANLREEKFELFREMARTNDYIKFYPVVNDDYPENYPEEDKYDEADFSNRYYVQSEGVDFLLKYKQTKKEMKHSNAIKWATIFIGFSAVVQSINILIYNEATKKFIFKIIENSFIAILTIIQKLYILVLIILLLYGAYKVYELYRENNLLPSPTKKKK